MPNGLLLQWGAATINNGYASFAFPTAFTTVCRVFPVVRDVWGDGGHIPVAYPDLSLETVTHNHLTAGGAMCRQVNGSSGVTPINSGTLDWFAIGY